MDALPPERTQAHKNVTPDDVQDYIEDRLQDGCRPHVENYLHENPSLGRHVSVMREQVVRLREFGERILHEPIPQRLIDFVRQHLR